MYSQSLQPSSWERGRTLHPRSAVELLSILLTIRKGHGTSHRHEGNGFLTLNAFIENVIVLRCSYGEKINLSTREIFFLSWTLRLRDGLTAFSGFLGTFGKIFTYNETHQGKTRRPRLLRQKEGSCVGCLPDVATFATTVCICRLS